MKNHHYLSFVHRLFVLTAVGFVVFGNADNVYPEHSFLNHPLYTLPQFASTRPNPVILRKYYFYRDSEPLVNRMLFAPRAANYVYHPSRTSFATNADVLVTPGLALDSGNKDVAIEAHLNAPARVIVLIAAQGASPSILNGVPVLSGAPSSWRPLSFVIDPSSPTLLGDPSRWEDNLFALPGFAAAVEVPLDDSLVIRLPHPFTMTVNGLKGFVYTLLFAKPGDGETLDSFSAPGLPSSFTSLRLADVNGGTTVNPPSDPPVPNRSCPSWLHDLYVTPTRTWPAVASKIGEPPFWRTWHPPIDPIYWCYYDHEHGSFPGPYIPTFDYTAFKTPDETEPSGHQNESHAGFKVFTLPIENYERLVVISVHMHLSEARRFTERRHTSTIAVLRRTGSQGSEKWTLEMELTMKMDFGPAEASYKNGTTQPFDAVGWAIEHELLSKHVEAGRRFNILNVDENFPESVDPAFLVKGGVSKGKAVVLNGIYEQWRGPLNTCSGSNGTFNRGFNFDVRDPATGMRTIETHSDDGLQKLNGKSMNRIIFISTDGVEIGKEFCFFNAFDSDAVVNLNDHSDEFYTDPYFQLVHTGPEKWSLRQTMIPNFQSVGLQPGHYTPIDVWSGWYEDEKYDIARRRFLDIERSVLSGIN